MEVKANLDSFDHIGVVVKNRKATIKSWLAKLCVESWRKTEAGQVPVALAHARMGETICELLYPLEDKFLWAEFLRTRSEELQHVCSRVDDVGIAS